MLWRVVRVAEVDGGSVAGFGRAGEEGMVRRRWTARTRGVRDRRSGKNVGMCILLVVWWRS